MFGILVGPLQLIQPLILFIVTNLKGFVTLRQKMFQYSPVMCYLWREKKYNSMYHLW